MADNQRPGAVSAIIDHIVQELAHSLDQPPASIDPDVLFVDMGADSLMLAEALQDINQRYRVSLPIGEIYESVNTIAKVADYIHNHGQWSEVLGSEVPGREAVEAPAPAVAPAMAPAPALAGAVPAEAGAVEDIVRRQLDLMERQLRLLAGQPAVVPPVAATPIVSATPTPVAAAPVTAAPAAPAGDGDRFSAFAVKLDRDGRDEDPRKLAHITALARTHNARTGGSKAMAQQYRRVLADNRVSAGFRPLLKDMVYPVLAETAEGAHLVDIDGNRYVDFTMGFGVHLFGHAPEFVTSRVRAQIDRGMAIGPQSPMAGRVAELIAELTGHDRVVFCNSGTEATMTALRLARLKAGQAMAGREQPPREQVVIFRNSYHGSFDGFLARSAAGGQTRPASLGTPPSMVADTVVLDYGDPEALRHIEDNHARIAAVLVEPVQSRAPAMRPAAFLAELRAITAARDIVLIFDEVISGFRCARGGAQDYFGVRADICTYGKVVGGGMPIGVVAGSAACLDGIDGGWWQYGDASYPAGSTIFFAGTFSKHPLTMAASLAVLEHLAADDGSLHDRLNATTEALAGRLTQVFRETGADVTIEQFSSLFRFASKGNLDLFFYQLLANGIYIWEGRNCFLSTAHAQADLDRLVDVVRATCAELVPLGLMPALPTAVGSVAAGSTATGSTAASRDALAVVDDRLPLSDAQQRFYRLDRSGPDGRAACNISFGFLFEAGIDPARLARAVTDEIRRHDALSLVPDLDLGAQAPADPERLAVVVADQAGPASPDRVERMMAAEQMTPLDLARGETLRLRIDVFEDGAALLGITLHHLVADGWSLSVLLGNIAAAMTGDTPAPALAYGDWIAHEHDYRASERHLADKAFWGPAIEALIAHQVAAATPPGNDGGRFRQGRIGARPGARARLTLTGEVSRGVGDAARAAGTTSFTWLLACTQLFLNRVSRNRLPVIGLPVANRTSRLRGLVGNCVNLLPLLPAEAGDFAAALAATREATSRLFNHARYAYHDICDGYQARAAAAGSAAVAGRETPVDITFNVEPLTGMPSFGGAVPELVAPVNGRIECDLMINLFPLPDGLRIELDYDTGLFAADVVHGWLNLLAKIIENQVAEAIPAREPAAQQMETTLS